MAVKRTRS